MTYLGNLPGSMKIKDGETHTRVRSPYLQFVNPYVQRMEEICGEDYFCVRPVKLNVEKTINSWDQKKPTTFQNDESFKKAIMYFSSRYGPKFRDCKMNTEELSDAITWNKDCGYPGNHYGFVSKEDLNSDPDYNHWEENLKMGKEFPPIWDVRPKKEFLPFVDVASGKIRLYQVPPLHYIKYQLKYGKRISERIKGFRWSAYGFNPYSGNFNSLAQQLLRKKIRFCYDVSGWDKFLPILMYVYNEILNRNEDDWTEEEKEEFRWVVTNVCSPIMKMPDGTTYMKDYGNPSGSGTTTRDNILCHVIIMAHALIEAYFLEHGEYPSFELLDEQVVKLFGDDNIAGVDMDFSLIIDEKFLSNHMEKYGMKLKFLEGGVNHPIEKLSFLGAHFTEKDGMYLPEFDTSRLATSVIFDQGNLNLAQYISKVRVLTIMSYPTKDWEPFKAMYNNMIDNLIDYQTDDPVMNSIVERGHLSDTFVEQFYTGNECTLQSSFGFLLDDPKNSAEELSSYFYKREREIIQERIEYLNSLPQFEDLGTGVLRDNGTPRPDYMGGKSFPIMWMLPRKFIVGTQAFNRRYSFLDKESLLNASIRVINLDYFAMWPPLFAIRMNGYEKNEWIFKNRPPLQTCHEWIIRKDHETGKPHDYSSFDKIYSRIYKVKEEGWTLSTLSEMKRTTRGEKILDRLVANANHPLTEDGKNWLIQVCDPFHDRPFKKMGWVDNNTRPSIVRQVKQQIGISAVSGGGAAVNAPWDCHIAWLPNLITQNVNGSASRQNNVITANATALTTVGGLTAMAQFNAGTAVNWTPTNGSTNLLGQLSVDPAYLIGDTRLVGVGFEVTDTSAKINKQGSCTVYAYPQDGQKEMSVINGNGGASALTSTPIPSRRVLLPPTTLQTATLLPGTRTWEAEFGCYVVPTFQDIHNKATCLSSVTPIYENQSTVFSTGAATTATCYFPILPYNVQEASTGTVITWNWNAPQYTKIAPVNSAGCILAGLNPSSTFTLSLVYYIETIPSIGQPGDVVLTQPPPGRCAWAMDLYTEIVTSLPPGVMVGENNSGDWFWGVVERIADAAAPVLQMIPHPIAQGAGMVARALGSNPNGNQMNNATPIAPKQPKKKKKKTAKMNRNLAAGNRTFVNKKGKVKTIQGPMRPPTS